MLGPYRVTGRIGEGGMGAVYRATDTRLGRNVAIKVLTAVTLSDKERLQRFEQEARATGMLNHPNLLTIYDVGNSDAPKFQMAATEPGMVLGTVGYMSPEQVRGEQVDRRSDIFAFGAILYEMLTGSRAFKRDSSIETLSAILKEEPKELIEVNPNVPPPLERLVRCCLEKDRDQRFGSARDLAFNLETLSTYSSPGTMSGVANPVSSRTLSQVAVPAGNPA